MRFAQGLGYDGFTAVPRALREELTQRSKGPLGGWEIEHGSNSEQLLRRAGQVSDVALEHRIGVAAVASAGRVTRIAVQRFNDAARLFPSVAPSNSFVMLAPRSFFPPNPRDTSTAPGASRTAFSWSAGRSRSIPSARRELHLDRIELPTGSGGTSSSTPETSSSVRSGSSTWISKRRLETSIAWYAAARSPTSPSPHHWTTPRAGSRTRQAHRLPPPHKGFLLSRNSCTVLSGRRHARDCGLRRHGQD